MTSVSAKETVEQSINSELVELLRDLVPGREVLADSHFFDDLGADSLTMTRFCARVRKRSDLPALSMRDIYARPSIAALTAHTSPAIADVAGHPDGPTVPQPVAAAPIGPALEAGRGARHVFCGIAQVVLFAGYSGTVTLVTLLSYDWVQNGTGFLDTYLRAVLAGGGGLLGLSLAPVLIKWLLVGRWKQTEIPLWGISFLRWWVVKSLLHASPVRLFTGTPVYVLYLRLLGARIGPNVTILSRYIPVCTDLLDIGAGSIVRNDCLFLGYRAHGTALQTGRVTLGAGVFVGEKTVLDIDTAIGDGAQLGHGSALQPGDRIPAHEHWHGTPAERTDIDHDRVPAMPVRRARRVGYGLSTAAQALLVWAPLLVAEADLLAPFTVVGPDGAAGLALDAVLLLVGLLAVGLVLLLAAIFVLPRVLRPLLRPGRVHPLYGRHYSAQRLITTLTNRKLFTWLFGDSSYIVGYLRALGYDLTDVEQTGSNFGTEVQHGTPFAVVVGSGTMVADGLSVLNVEYSATSFRVSPVRLGANSFLGNNIALPPDARVGDNCLLATKVMVPLDGPVRTGVGLLGSPAFEIPRTVERDTRYDHLRSGPEFAQRLRAKNRYNLRSMGLMLGARWVALLLVAAAAVTLLRTPHDVAGVLGVLAFAPVAVILTAAWWIGVERVFTRKRLRPRLVSIYDPYFWWHERLWKVPDLYLNVLNATPMKSLVWRLLGVRIGRRVFDDGAYLTERTLTSIGDDTVLNAQSKLQAHSQEDGTFKCDHIELGRGVTVGVGAFLHYGTQLGDGAVIAADSFLMKGEQVPEHARWLGNPATPAGEQPC